MKRAIAIKQAALPEEHPDTTNSQAGLAGIRAAMPCDKCGVQGVKLKHCSVCKLTYYCSTDCQVRTFFSCLQYIVHVMPSQVTVCFRKKIGKPTSAYASRLLHLKNKLARQNI
jgi:hypothetical protein